MCALPMEQIDETEQIRPTDTSEARAASPTVVVSRRIHEAALAVTMDGTVLIGVAHFGGEQDPEVLLRLAFEQNGDLFIGVAMTETEMARTLMRLDNASREAAGFVIGERQRREMRKGRR